MKMKANIFFIILFVVVVAILTACGRQAGIDELTYDVPKESVENNQESETSEPNDESTPYAPELTIQEGNQNNDTESEKFPRILLFETDFESGYDGVAARGGATATRTNAHSRSGNYSVLISERSASWHGAIIDVTELTESFGHYEFSVWVKPVDTSVSFQLTVQYTLNGEYTWRHLSGSSARVTARPGRWTELRGSQNWYQNDQAHLIIETDNAGAGASFYIDDIMLFDISPELVFVDLPSLREVYRDYFVMGVAIMPLDLYGIRREVKEHHFGSFTVANDLKPAHIQPRPGVFTFDIADRMVQMAMDADSQKVGHTLVWHHQSPEWMNPSGIAGDEAIRHLEEHIYTLVTRYQGRITVWDVVNEAFPSSVPLATAADWRANLRSTPWLDAIGYEFIEIAFRAAHAADPYAVLLYNDYNLDHHGKREAVFHMVQELLERGVPIHGIGMQGHYNLTTRHRDVEASILRFSELGIPVHFTELDVYVPNSAGQANLTPEQELAQAIFYARLFLIFREHHELIDRVTFWGMDDGTSWRRERFPTLFNRDFTPKLAFFAVIDPEGFLQEHGY